MTHAEMIAVIQHHTDGGEVEYKKNFGEHWLLMLHEVWNFAEYDYRIKEKPKTKVVYEWMYEMGAGLVISDILKTEQEAESYAKTNGFMLHQKTGRSWEVPND